MSTQVLTKIEVQIQYVLEVQEWSNSRWNMATKPRRSNAKYDYLCLQKHLTKVLFAVLSSFPYDQQSFPGKQIYLFFKSQL